MNEFKTVSTEELCEIDGGLLPPIPAGVITMIRVAVLIRGVADAVVGAGQALANLARGLL
jgi:hypothetical protein